MRFVVLLLAFMLAACGGSSGEVELDVAAGRDGGTITVEVATNLPDGAVISWTVFDDSDDAIRGDDLTVDGGSAAGEVDVKGMEPTEVEVAFLPGYKAQPDDVAKLEAATETVPVN